MSEIEMKRIAGNMMAGYSAVLRYLEITKKGNIDQLRSTVSFAFGLSPRTAHERINLMIDSGAISIHGKIWVWNINPDGPLWKQVNLRLDSANNQDY